MRAFPDNEARPTAAVGGASGIPVGGSLTLAMLLNVLWRWRWLVIGLTLLGLAAGFVYGLVVDPLYLATAQVKPGITAFVDGRAPVRDWHLKDITRFFDRRLYMDDVRQAMGWGPAQGYPIIKADFIPRGSQNIQGGNVVTLTTLAPSRREARGVLAAAIQSFISFAVSDTVASGYVLTKRGMEVEIAKIRNELGQLATEAERLDLDIGKQEAELRLLEAEDKRVQLDVDRIRKANEYRQERLQRSEAEAQAAMDGLGELDAALARLRDGGEQSLLARDSLVTSLGNREPLTDLLLSDLARSDAGVIGDLVLGRLQVRSRAYRDQAAADSLRHEIDRAEFELANLQLKRDFDLSKRRDDIQAKIAELKLERDRGLEYRRLDLQSSLLGRRAQLSALSPLERVGFISATPRPVRPRRLRAILILGCLGFCGGVALAFTWDYVSSHRDEIFAQKQPRG
jgi:hypothetical protein